MSKITHFIFFTTNLQYSDIFRNNITW